MAIVDPFNKDLADNTNVSFVNLLPHALINNVTIDVGGKQCTDLSQSEYMYKSYMEHIFTYNRDAINSHQASALFFPDAAGQYDTVAAAQGVVTGHATRGTLARNSRKLQFCVPFTPDYFMADRYAPPGLAYTIKVYRNPDAFCLMGLADVRAKLTFYDLKLELVVVKLDDAVKRALLAKMATTPMLFPLVRNTMKTFHAAAASTNFTVPSLFSGVLPRTIIFGMVATKAYNGECILWCESVLKRLTYLFTHHFTGSLVTNPFNFQHFNLSQAFIRYRGEQIPSEPYTFNFDVDYGCARSYYNLFSQTGLNGATAGNRITYDQYKGGSFFVAFDITADRYVIFIFHASPSKIIL